MSQNGLKNVDMYIWGVMRLGLFPDKTQNPVRFIYGGPKNMNLTLAHDLSWLQFKSNVVCTNVLYVKNS